MNVSSLSLLAEFEMHSIHLDSRPGIFATFNARFESRMEYSAAAAMHIAVGPAHEKRRMCIW